MDEKTTTGRRLVTFLGLTDYREVDYQWKREGGNDQSHRSYFVARALLAWSEAEPISEVLVLGTKESFEKNGVELDKAMMDAGLPKPLRKTIPSGASPEDLWQLFDVTKCALRAPKGESVLLDITHGFRMQPFFAAAVLFFLRAVDDEVTPVDVVYGAPTGDNLAVFEIWEFTPFVELVDWALGLQIFLKTGRADEIAATTELIGKRLGRAWSDSGKKGERPKITQLAVRLKSFSDDLQTVRTGDLLLPKGSNSESPKPSSAKALLEAVEQSREELKEACPPIADIVDRILEMVKPLPTSSLGGEEGHKAVVALARHYMKLKRYSEAAATMREGWVNRYAAHAALVPGQDSYCKPARDEAEYRLFSNQEDILKRVGEVRNTLMHSGYGSKPLPAKALIEQLGNRIDELEAEGAKVSAPVLPTEIKKRFLNISNHPSADWCAPQRAAALAMAPEIDDHEFPRVNPSATAKDIETMARELVAKIAPGDVRCAMVMGEHSLTMALVQQLQQRNICCVVATTERLVETTVKGDKLSRFDFVGFRDYPSLATRDETP